MCCIKHVASILTCPFRLDWPDWQHHRKITASQFNERNCRLVWTESLRQTEQMVEYWDEKGSSGVNSVASDAMTLALHVITLAGFGISYSFRSGLYGISKEGSPNYRDCLGDVMGNVVLLTLLPRWMYSMPFLPKTISKFCNNVRSLKNYMVRMVQDEKEKKQSSLRIQSEANILSTLVAKSEEARLGLEEDQSSSKQPSAAEERLDRRGAI